MKHTDRKLDDILGLKEKLEDPGICKVCNRPLNNWYGNCYHELDEILGLRDFRCKDTNIGIGQRIRRKNNEP